MNKITFKFCAHFLFVVVNSIRFATRLNQMSCNGGKTDGETKKSKRKCLFFDLNQKHLQVFHAFYLLKNTKETNGETQKI